LDRIGFLPSLTIPVLTIIRDLSISIRDSKANEEETSSDSMDSVLPQDSSLSHCFPSVEEISIKCRTSGMDLKWDSYFRFSDPARNVKTVHFSNFVPSGWLINLGNLFPCTEELHLIDIPFSGELQNIWSSFKNLKCLVISFKMGEVDRERTLDSSLDSVITGIPSEVCKKLKEQTEMVENGEELRVAPSIIELKGNFFIFIIHIT